MPYHTPTRDRHHSPAGQFALRFRIVKLVGHFALLLILLSLASPFVAASAVCAQHQQMAICEHCRHAAAPEASVSDGQPRSCCHFSKLPAAPTVSLNVPPVVQGTAVPKVVSGVVPIAPASRIARDERPPQSGHERQVLLCTFLV